MSAFILETEHLTKKFGGQTAVDDVSLQIQKGGVYGLLGPNGAGKSTILKLILGLLRPTGGTVLFDGKPWRRERLSKIGSLIESPALYGNLTAEENLLVHTRLLGIPRERIREALEMVDLTNTGKKRASQFSVGMKERLGIAIALLGEPELLILDEPTNGLDPAGIQALRGLIEALAQKGMTVLLSSHILPEVAQVADHIGIVSDGRLLFQGRLDPDVDLEKFFLRIVKEGAQR